jgi:multidrug resistance protein MdtO
LTLLDRIESVLHNLPSMPKDIARTDEKKLVALPSKRVPLLVPNGFRNPDSIGFALKLSLCVTICYVSITLSIGLVLGQLTMKFTT